jgi:hypothetical protein
VLVNATRKVGDTTLHRSCVFALGTWKPPIGAGVADVVVVVVVVVVFVVLHLLLSSLSSLCEYYTSQSSRVESSKYQREMKADK